MTTEEFADQYAREKGFPTGLNEMIMRCGIDVDEFIFDMLKAYALSVLPSERKEVSESNPLKPVLDTFDSGFNDCIDQTKKNIG